MPNMVLHCVSSACGGFLVETGQHTESWLLFPAAENLLYARYLLPGVGERPRYRCGVLKDHDEFQTLPSQEGNAMYFDFDVPFR